MYVVTGITGQVGGALARSLLASGAPVRAVGRDAEKIAAWARLGCETALADYADVPALTAALSGAEGAFILLPPAFDPAPGNPAMLRILAALTEAIASARPRRIVALSTIGAQATRPSLLSWLGIMERQFATLPVPAAFLRAAWFMENAAWDVAPARETRIVRSFLQPLDRAFPMVATADIGRVAARMLRESWEGRRIVELEGPRRVSPNDLAGAFAKTLGRPVRAERVPRETWDSLFVAQGMANPLPRIAMLDGFNEGWIDFESGAAGTLKGEVELETVVAELVAARG
ncbi:NmrA family NAD(P)-binding protein [Methylocella sp.]|uniref:NmrA family NAD(P)-binding protein n=1 Tax=Methylocella sp. TaxID=1978226 RepID=UPI0037830D74